MPKTRILFETFGGASAQSLAAESASSGHIQVLAGPASWYLGWRHSPRETDSTALQGHYEVTEFVRGVVDGVPELVQALWCEPSSHTVFDPHFVPLIENRGAFLSTRAVEQFMSRSWAMWQTLCERRAWLTECPLLATTREEYEIDHPAPAGFAARLRHEQKYEAARRRFNRFDAWQESRSPIQAKLEARSGYDGDLAMHALRLARMAHEIATDGHVVVRRPDRAELLAIGEGGSSFEAIERQLDDLSHAVTDAQRSGQLPSEPNENLATELVARLLTEHLVTSPR